MKKSLLLFFLFAGLFFKISYSQAPLAAASNPNYIHDKLTELYAGSFYKSEVPDSVYTILKNFARNKHIDENIVLRNIYMFKVLYYEGFTIDDRLFAVKQYIKANNGIYEYAPLYFLKEIEATLNSKKLKQ